MDHLPELASEASKLAYPQGFESLPALVLNLLNLPVNGTIDSTDIQSLARKRAPLNYPEKVIHTMLCSSDYSISQQRSMEVGSLFADS